MPPLCAHPLLELQLLRALGGCLAAGDVHLGCFLCSFGLSLLCLQVCAGQVQQAALARAVAVLGTLCADVGLRAQLAQSRECWQGCLQLLVRDGLWAGKSPFSPELCPTHP